MAAVEEGWDGIDVRAYSMATSGTLNERIISREFWDPAGTQLEAEGFEYVADLDDGLSLPPALQIEPNSRKPTAAVGVDDALVAISLYLAVKVGDWAVGRICDYLWERRMRKPLETMLERRRNEGYANKQMVFAFGVWYDLDEVYIGTRATLGPDEDGATLADLTPQAQRRGVEWIETHGITHPVILFPVQNGALADVPEHPDSIPG